LNLDKQLKKRFNRKPLFHYLGSPKKEIVNMHFAVKRIVELTCLIALFFVLGCDNSKTDNTGNRGVFRYNQASGISSLDPAFAKDQANIWVTNQLFNGLVQMDDSLQVQPCIARSWEVSPDGKTYTFYLRTDVFFHDHPVFDGGKGPKVTANEVVYSFNRLIDPQVASTGAWLFNNRIAPQQPFYARNDSVFELRLSAPFPPMLSILTMQYCSIVPKQAVEHFGKNFRNNPIGTGPFMFKTWIENEALILTANPRYFETDAAGKPLPYIDGVKVSFMENKRSAYLKFIAGELDFLSGIDATYKDDILTPDGKLHPNLSEKVQLLRSPYLNTEYLGFMLGNGVNAPLTNKKVRQAINYGINRNQIVQYLRNNIGIAATSGFVPQGLPSFNAQTVKGYTYQPQIARRLLTEAGYENGKGLPPITLETTDAYQDISVAIQKQLSEIGIKINLQLNPPAFLREKTAKGEAQFFRASWIADYPDAESYLTVLYGDNPAPPNYTRFKNQQFDQLYQQAMQETNTQKRYELYQKLDRIVIEEAPIVPLFYDEVLRFTQNRVQNLGINPLNLLHLKRVMLSVN